ncbi:methylthioribulose 1-phosphate dehydratase [Bacillus swezeyi]|uniref:Methylthioribulose-1-phosphate dehydratase n=2 Tax=Bacillus swezeyi TaxID=1925020 RepID=A0A1R1QYQ8_9BACI|nr:methylthioribulose 1-phosphate dehydratase [Bacillus swezeyi]MEC1262385.1 methylthioribulose 1-phosphate dehydratase [Bacillus swezeyi]MED2926906.1 methylthioribulose 1-phosphate dehydratase [Bacillus swezeyi]MED2965532.1 methylthioribulose 1-phosphate dehydratase [Bacillus swezeyi]MED3071065.1 methylthioribulose 1-phosphate dehydratase [Bacillus swezeyi]MED3083226.1 methylthioribulose 1-phosphate dehydratase [Bacillus swezeyi]
MVVKQKRWLELAEVKRELAARDWFPATSGNLSIKVSDEPLRFLVTASGKDKRKETNEDFLLADEEGRPAESGHSLKPSAETLLHAYVYQKTNAGCCLHVHTVDNNVISELYAREKQMTFKGQEIIKALGYWEENAEITIPIIENTAHIPDLAAEFAAHLSGDSGAVLIRSHGITVWGRTAFEAKRVLEAYEFLFSWHVKLKAFRPEYV